MALTAEDKTKFDRSVNSTVYDHPPRLANTLVTPTVQPVGKYPKTSKFLESMAYPNDFGVYAIPQNFILGKVDDIIPAFFFIDHYQRSMSVRKRSIRAFHMRSISVPGVFHERSTVCYRLCINPFLLQCLRCFLYVPSLFSFIFRKKKRAENERDEVIILGG